MPVTPPPVFYDAGASPALDPGEVDAAIHAGGVLGLIDAMTARMSPDVATLDRIRAVARSPEVRAVAMILDQYREGSGAADQRELLAAIDRVVVATDLLHNVCLYVGLWLARSPGTVIADGRCGNGRRRVFP